MNTLIFGGFCSGKTHIGTSLQKAAETIKVKRYIYMSGCSPTYRQMEMDEIEERTVSESVVLEALNNDAVDVVVEVSNSSIRRLISEIPFQMLHKFDRIIEIRMMADEIRKMIAGSGSF